MVASILFAIRCVLPAYKGMSKYAITLSFSYIGLGWVFEIQGTIINIIIIIINVIII